MRFEGRFSSRISSALRPLAKEGPTPEIRVRAMMDELRQLSAALDIAVGTTPEVDLLDMVTMVALGRDLLGAYWKAHAPPERARVVQEAFDTSLEDILAVARAVITPDQEKELLAIVAAWRKEHPDQIELGAMRLSEYTGPPFAASPALEKRTSRFFATVRGATQTADDAVLLGARALYAAQRLPFLFRMHVRVATSDSLLDVKRTLDEVEAHVRRVGPPLLARVFLAGSGVAVVAAASWLFARMAGKRLLAR
jgi:hypothetical protein